MSISEEELVRAPESDANRILVLVDSSLGLISIVARTTGRSARVTRGLTSPVLHGLQRLPVHPTRPRALSDKLRRRGSPVREHVATTGVRMIDIVVPFLVEQVLRRVDLTELVRRHVDVDGVVAEVDIDAVLDRVDLDAVAGRLNIDAVAARLDIDAVLDRLDLDAVAGRLDIDAVAARLDIDAVLDRLDLDAAAGRLDIDAVAARLDIDAVLDRMDLTALALRRLDLATLASAVLAKIDLAAVAQEVIEAVDLPEMIRDSSGALTSDTVRGARMRSAAADQALSRVRDRLLLHRDGARAPTVPTLMPAQPGSEVSNPPERP